MSRPRLVCIATSHRVGPGAVGPMFYDEPQGGLRLIRLIDDQDLAAEVARAERGFSTHNDLMDWAYHQPGISDGDMLIGGSVAAEMLGIAATHIARLRKSGRLIAIPVQGGYSVYLRSAVEALAAELQAERKRRGQRANG